MSTAQSGKLVMTLVFEDLGGKPAYGYPTDVGQSTIHADQLVLDDVTEARVAAFSALIEQAELHRRNPDA